MKPPRSPQEAFRKLPGSPQEASRSLPLDEANDEAMKHSKGRSTTRPTERTMNRSTKHSESSAKHSMERNVDGNAGAKRDKYGGAQMETLRSSQRAYAWIIKWGRGANKQNKQIWAELALVPKRL